ncbi:MAG: hypothetical protein M0Q88_02285 [Bacilli bacterium]|nr:hypothetical protein [Bacilli bacterium]
MNSSQIFKRTIPVLIVILLVVGAAVIASVINRDKLVPSITDEDGVYLTINEGGRSYDISKKYMYDELKKNVGLRVLLDQVDRHLLTNHENGKYLNEVTDEQIDEDIDKQVFPNGKEGLTEDEIQEKYDEYYSSLSVGSGLRSVAEVRDYHKLTLAKRAYAKDKLTEEIERVNKLAEEDDSLDPFFKESDYETKHKANYLPAYWAIIIPFQSAVEAKLALEQVGLKVDEDSKSGSYANLVKNDEDETALTPTEIAEAFIEMYNTFYARFIEDYPTNRLTLVDDVQFSYDDENKLTFNSSFEEDEENAAMNKLHFTNQEVANISKQVENFLKGMQSYAPDSTSNKWYTAEPRVYDGKLHVYILKIKAELVPELSTVRDEIYEILFEEELTDAYISKKMMELRESNKFEILDPVLEENYVNLVEGNNFEFKKTKAEDEKIIAKVKDLDITADSLFATMDKYYGMSLIASEINYLRFLNSAELNKIYDYYTPDLTQGQRVLDKEKWEEVRNATVNEKNIFLAGGYSSYPPTYGWKNFLRDYYGVSDIEGLMYTLLYTRLRSDFASSLLDVEELTETSAKWLEVKEYMEKIKDDYFSVNGLQLLISVKDEAGNYVPQEEWTDLQTEYAEELYGKVWEYIDAEAGDYDANLNAFVTKFKDAPRFLASLEQDVEAQPELEGNPYVIEEEGVYTIEVSKYKSAGLNIEFLRVSQLSNTSSVTDANPERLHEVAKEIFNSLPVGSTTEVRYGYTFGSSEYEYLVSKTGYHVYINTSIVDAPTWNYTGEEEKHILPTLEMIKTIAKDNASNKLYDLEGNITETEFTQAMKDAVTKYFNPIRNEIVGGSNLSIILYKQMQEIDLDFKVNNYSEAEFNSFLNEVIEIYEDSLTYINEQE